ncbi:MAG: NapC/NirT family cytochrome c [Gammaproteobacteria bacterium]|nr:MAG: NapC/NirT family cytochrome c [Gammaproteobacteria bacterium]
MADSSRKFGMMSRKVVLGTTLGAALFFMIVGVIFWGGFNTAMEATNTMDFCISCHEMEENVYKEYTSTVHFSNRSGVQATCSDCHVPDPWMHKVVRKVQATNELYHKALGSIDTPEKFDAKRLQLAKNVWRAMKETDSRECRNCHDFASMNPENQKKRARKQHILGMEQGNTCIDCHKGVAHKKVHDKLSEEELIAMEQPRPEDKRPIPPQWQAFIDGDTGTSGEVAAASETAPEAAAEEPAAQETTAEEAEAVEVAQATSEQPAAGSAAPAGGSIDWSGIEAYPVTLFYTGQASMEWVLKGSDHGGKRAFVTGDRCFDCHEEEEVDIGDLIISGEKAEDTPIEGKRGSIVVNVKAAHDADNLYMQFQWDDVGEHVPVPFVDGGKMDPDNPIKLAIMIATDDEDNPQVEYAERSGCWQTCHHDLNYMPHQPGDDALSGPLASRLDLSDGFTKYLKESRTEIEIEGKDGKKRGGWDKLKEQAEIDAALVAGSFMDLLRYKAGTGESEDGHILEQRVMSGGQGVTFDGGLADGVWTIEMVRKLTSDKPGDVSMATDQWYNIGFAIHDDYTSSRFHHVSLGFKLGFDDEDAEINAIGQ